MQCPQKDGVLVAHQLTDSHGVAKTYHACPTCLGMWMDLFSANYLTIADIPAETIHENQTLVASVCPTCATPLAQATGDNIPQDSRIYRCPQGHGYFFTEGEFTIFKKAQEAKLNYLKTWRIPIASIASVLLAGLVIVVLSGGLLATLKGVGTRQNTESQASTLIQKQRAYVGEAAKSVTIALTTSKDTHATLNVDALGYHSLMKTQDQRNHTMTILTIPSGTYTYYFTFSPETNEPKQEYQFIIP